MFSKNVGTINLIRMLGLVLVITLTSVSVGLAQRSQQNDEAYIRKVRRLETENIGPIVPVGLAYSNKSKAFYVIENRAGAQPQDTDTEVIALSTFADPIESARISASITDPINTTFDNHFNRLLIFQPNSNQLIIVDTAPNGSLDPRSLTRYNARHFALQDPQGMAVDPSNGDLFILDSAVPQILHIEPAPDGGFEDALIEQISLEQFGTTNLRGLAFDPSIDNLYVFNHGDGNLYEITAAGQVVGTRDLSQFDILDPQGMIFAPSADQTDDPEQLNLYIADSKTATQPRQTSGLVESSTDLLSENVAQGTFGEIAEFSFTELPTIEAATSFTSSLVQTIHTYQWSPPSPDPSGIIYLPASDTLMVVDGEVNEMSIYAGANVFESTLQGNLIDTWNTLSFSNEPTGVSVNLANSHLFISQDTPPKVVYELDPGPDSTYGTPDDNIVTSVITADFGSNDPEGVTYANGLNVLFIADGVNNEIYRLDPGNNGLFDGVPPAGDDQLTSFDTVSLGLQDPEGVAYNPDNGNLYIAGKTPNIGTRNFDTLLEVTTSGSLVQTIDVSDANANKLSGLAYGPCSNNPSLACIYIVDRAVDNNSNPNENDGEIYVMSLPGGVTNSPPIANDDSANTSQNTLVTIDVAANDSDPNGNLDPATTNTNCGTCSGTGPGSTLVNNGDGTFDYTPSNNFTGSDGFVYEICDSGSPSLCDTAIVSITVTVANDPPVANNDSVTTSEDTLTLINVAANDTDPDNNLDATTTNTTCATCSETSNGSLANNGDGTFNYTPNANFNGSDGFTYEICDDLGTCDTASVNITINPVNDLPQAVNDSASTTETTPILIDVAFNDTDPDGNLNPASANTGCTGCSGPGNGNLVNNGNGTFTYTADPGFIGSDSFVYEICDTTSLCDTATVNVTVSEQQLINTIYLSSNGGGTAGGVGFKDEDILAFDYASGTYSMHFDGSDVGLGASGVEIDAFHINPDGTILISVEPSTTIPDVGSIDDTDIVRFIPTSTGDNTAGSYEMYFDGSDVGLDANTGDDIDGLGIAPDGNLVISARGHYDFGTISGIDTDLLKFNATSLGDITSGSWELYFDGLDVGVGDGGNNEDVTAVWIAPNGDIHLSARIDFSVEGVTGDSSDIYVCEPSSLGQTTVCTFRMFWDGSQNGFAGQNLNGITIEVTGGQTNDPPVANSDSYSTNEDTLLNVAAPGVLSNDSDGDSNPLTAVLQNTTSNGILTLNPDGSFEYSPNPNFFGLDSFTYFANDGTANSAAPATVTITVTPVNDLPTAVDDSYTTDEDTPLSIPAPGVLSNDTDADGDLLTAVPGAGPTNGSLTLNSDGSFTYTPNASFFGTDSFTYFANDGTANSAAPATVTITVTPVNDLPTAVDDDYTTDEDTPLNVPAPGVLDNDTDTDGDPLTAVLQNSTTNGSLTLNNDGSFDYTPNANFSGTDSFTYFANDGTANSALPATVSINVNSVNDPPTAVDDNYITDEDTALNVAAPGVLTNDSDPENDPLTAVLVSDVSNGSLSLNADGSFDYTPNANFNGSDSFTYTANDGTTDSNVATVSLTVTPVNDPPVANDDIASTTEGTAVSIDVSANDTDVDGNLDPTKASSACANGSAGCLGAANGSLTDNGDGTITYTPNPDFNGIDSFVYEICDSGLLCDTATVSITITPVNDPPVANDDTDSTSEDTPIVIDVAANDTDVDGNLDPNSANSACANGSAGCLGAANGSLTDNGDGTITYTPNLDFNGIDSFVYEICDTIGSCDTATVNISISPIADPPLAVNDSETTTEGIAVIIDVAANDSDPDGNLDPNSANSTCANGSSGCLGATNGSLIDNGDGTITYTPDLDFNGIDSFVYEICDSGLLCDTATVSITITPVNDPPVANDDTDSTSEDTAVVIDVAANDTDPDGNLDPTTANSACANGSSGCLGATNGSLTDNGDGTITYTPNPDFNGNDSFVYEICDSGLLCDTAIVSITVTPVNDLPTAVDDDYTTDEDTPLNIPAQGVLDNDADADGDPLTAVLQNSTPNGSLTLNSDGSFNYIPSQQRSTTITPLTKIYP